MRGLQLQVSVVLGSSRSLFLILARWVSILVVAGALIRGFIALYGHNTIESQRLAWRGIPLFALALARAAAAAAGELY